MDAIVASSDPIRLIIQYWVYVSTPNCKRQKIQDAKQLKQTRRNAAEPQPLIGPYLYTV